MRFHYLADLKLSNVTNHLTTPHPIPVKLEEKNTWKRKYRYHENKIEKRITFIDEH